MAVEPGDMKKHQTDHYGCMHMAVAMSLPYQSRSICCRICFSVVQNLTSTIGPVSWLCLEARLSVMRLAIWAWNLARMTRLHWRFILEMYKYKHKPLPTCNKEDEEILDYKLT